eukprot:symbB.v1.2.003016.t1/scaffold113.1/size324549/14
MVAHRDLKLENLLLDKSREAVKIIDFGFAAHVPSKETKLKAFCGTPSCPDDGWLCCTANFWPRRLVGTVVRMAEIDAVLLDVDDTLYPVSSGFSDHRNGEVICKFMVENLGFETAESAKILRDEYFQRYHSTMKGLNIATEEGRLPKPFKQEELGQYWADHCDYEKFIRADPVQIEVIRSLAEDVGLKMAVFTNSPKKYALKCLEFLGVRKYFPDDRVFAVEDVLPACKPQPEAFKKVLDAIGAVPERTVMFEDSMKNIRACKALGIHTVLVHEGDEAGGEAALLGDTPVRDDPAVDVVIKDMSEVRAKLPGLWKKRFDATPKTMPSYMAPEIIRGEGYSGFAADVWALGVVIFALLSGTLPFAAKTEMQLYARIRRGSFNFPDGSFGEIQKRLIRGVMRKEAAARPSAAALLQHAWVAGRDSIENVDPYPISASCTPQISPRAVKVAIPGAHKAPSRPHTAPIARSNAHGHGKCATSHVAHVDLARKLGPTRHGAIAFGGS